MTNRAIPMSGRDYDVCVAQGDTIIARVILELTNVYRCTLRKYGFRAAWATICRVSFVRY